MAPNPAAIALLAALDGNLRLLKKMSKKMDLRETKDPKGLNALHFAANKGSLEICKFLVEEVGLDINSTSSVGATPMFYAALKGNAQVVRYLLDHGSDPAKASERGLTPLHNAAEHGHCEAVRLLLSKGVEVDAINYRGTPLHMTAAKGQHQAMKILLEHGADPNRVVNHVFSPLMMACCGNNLECMKLLIEAGADVNGSTGSGPTPLTGAVDDGSTELVKFLLDAGADPNIPNQRMTNARTYLYQQLLNEHSDLSERHGQLLLQLKAKSGAEKKVEELQRELSGLRTELQVLRKRQEESIPLSELATQLEERDKKHQAESQLAKEEIAGIKLEMSKLQSSHELEVDRLNECSARALAEQKTQLESLSMTRLELLEKVQSELLDLKKRTDSWLESIRGLDASLSETFPESDPEAARAIARIRGKRLESGPLSPGLEFDDMMASLTARVKPLGLVCSQMINELKEVFQMLWPEEELPSRVKELMEFMETSQSRFDEWRESSCRVGADEALLFLLSWLEDFDPDKIVSVRVDSPWHHDPEFIKRRKANAARLASFYDTTIFVPDPEETSEGEAEEAEEGEEASADPEPTPQGDVPHEPGSSKSS